MRYLWDDRRSRFTVQAFARGMLGVFGHSPTFVIRTFSGEIRFTPENAVDAVLNLLIQADSLTVTDAVSTKDRDEIERRMRQEVLETALYPEIVYRSTKIAASTIADNWFQLHLAGTLALHGVEGVQRLEAQMRIMENQVRLAGEFTLLQSAYRIKKISALGGLITVKDELKFSFDIIGKKEEA